MLSIGDIVTVTTEYKYMKYITNQHFGIIRKVYPHPSEEYCAYQVHWLDAGLSEVLNYILFYSKEIKKI